MSLLRSVGLVSLLHAEVVELGRGNDDGGTLKKVAKISSKA